MIKQIKQHRPRIKRIGVAMIAGAIVCGITTFGLQQTAIAQTDFDIRSESQDLKSEFQKELDKWMLRAYEGDRDAQFKVGVLFANDQFGPPENEQAVYWYRKAARQNHVLAQYNLGHHYLTGAGVKRDETAAMQWWLKAAQQQHALAQFNVGRAYYLGIGLTKDLSQARLWFERASQNKEPKSTEILKQLGWWDPSSVAMAEQPEAIDSPAIKAPEAGTNGSKLRSKIAPIVSPETSEQLAYDESSEAASKWVTGQSSASPDLNINDNVDDNIDTNSNLNASASTETTTEAPSQTAPRSDSPSNDATNEPAKALNTAIAVFTNPAVRSVLITIMDDANLLSVINENDPWTTVTAERGFPVWVHKNYIKSNGSAGTITAKSVNARSVPLITTGSIVGRLDRGEKVKVLDQRNDWFRIMSPKRFKGWVKTKDLVAAQTQTTQAALLNTASTTDSGSTGTSEASKPAPSRDTETKTAAAVPDSDIGTDTDYQPLSAENLSELAPSLNNNDWLFAQDETHYALQLASFSNTKSVERFVNSLSFKNSKNLRLYTSVSNDGIEWVYVMYGSYSTAEVAKRKSSELKQRRAWIRRFGVLQQNRCLAWKKQLPAPKELNEFCK